MELGVNGLVKVLVIDDEEMVRLNLEAFLEDEGFVVSCVESAEEALGILGHFQPQVMIVDMRLTGMNGNDLVIQAMGRDPGMKIIIHTGSLEYNLPNSLKLLGIRDHQVLYKPLPDMGQISSLIGSLVR